MIDILIVIWNIAKVLVGFGLMIFIHELGHFLLAKWNGVRVEKFSLGFGPRLFGFTRGNTQYILAAVPLGGYVKMAGETLGDNHTGAPDEFWDELSDVTAQLGRRSIKPPAEPSGADLQIGPTMSVIAIGVQHLETMTT